jgi:hypothetical protein
MISLFVTGVSCSAFSVLPNPIEDVLFTSLSEGDTLSSVSGLVPPCAMADWTWDRGHSKALVSLLMETGILKPDSAISLTSPMC